MTPRKGQPAGSRETGEITLKCNCCPGDRGIFKIGGFRAKVDGKDLRFAHRRKGEKEPLKEWHEMRLEVRDGLVKVYLNGILVNEAAARRIGTNRPPGRAISWSFVRSRFFR